MKYKVFIVSLALFSFAVAFALLVTACGHNIATQTKGIGIDVSWTGNSYVPNLKLGYWDDNNAVVRGNTTVSSSTASGGNVIGGGGGTSQTLQIATGTQVNEGYIKDILTDPNLDTVTKVAFVEALTKLQQPQTANAYNQTTSTASGITKETVEVPDPEQQIKDTEQEIEVLIKKLETLERSADAPKAVPAAEQK